MTQAAAPHKADELTWAFEPLKSCTCPQCHGAGYLDRAIECPNCFGHGEIYRLDDSDPVVDSILSVLFVEVAE